MYSGRHGCSECNSGKDVARGEEKLEDFALAQNELFVGRFTAGWIGST
jgi:hypothetical protein